MKSLLRDLRWILPAGLVLGFLFQVLDGSGRWWIGGLAYFVVFFLGLLVIAAAWRWACSEQDASASRTLGLILLIALVVRIALTVAVSYILPIYGSGSDVQKAGYLFRDALNRDDQAWKLASSSMPPWKAFDKSYSADQYGGLLAISAFLYRYISPDAHRPWLLAFLGALVSVAGIAIAWKAVQRTWGDSMAKPVAWILALYPEAFMQASSQMREPFLVTFIIMAFWGVLDWQSSRRQAAWAWVAGGLIGLLLFSPGIAIFAMIGMAGWLWFQGKARHISWRLVLIAGGVLVVALFLLWLGLARGALAGKSPLEVFSRWLGLSVQYNLYLTLEGSGWMQTLFKVIPASLQVPFVTLYGILRPLLPAAILEESTLWPWRVIGVVRAVGWYALLPFLVASAISIWQSDDRRERQAWVWLAVVTLVWIVLSSLRAGGDDWDNPRYRTIFLLWEALLAANAWVWWRAKRNPWMARILIIEGIFLLLFLYWYMARYAHVNFPILSPFIILAIILGGSLIVLLVGWITDRRRKRKPS